MEKGDLFELDLGVHCWVKIFGGLFSRSERTNFLLWEGIAGGEPVIIQ